MTISSSRTAFAALKIFRVKELKVLSRCGVQGLFPLLIVFDLQIIGSGSRAFVPTSDKEQHLPLASNVAGEVPEMAQIFEYHGSLSPSSKVRAPRSAHTLNFRGTMTCPTTSFHAASRLSSKFQPHSTRVHQQVPLGSASRLLKPPLRYDPRIVEGPFRISASHSHRLLGLLG